MTEKPLTLEQYRFLFQNGEASARELTEMTLKRIHQANGAVNAFVTTTENHALRQADALDGKSREDKRNMGLAGVPMALKDNICTKNVLTTCGSEMLADFVPPYDATVSRLLENAGTILMGKTNLDEFAMGSSTESSHAGPTSNPWDLERVPGGSSGGSAAAVAAGMVPLAIGSDTGGSIRQPASFCGVVGLKPTYGLVSRYGLVAFASSLDQIGSLTRTVKDNALALEVLAVHDQADATSIKCHEPNTYTEDLERPLAGLKAAIPTPYRQKGTDPEIRRVLESTITHMEKLGIAVDEIPLPYSEAGLSAYYLIASAEASSNLARFDGVRYGYRPASFETLEELMIQSRSEAFGSEVKRRIMLGTYALSSGYYDAYYHRAQLLRNQIRDQFSRVFSQYDMIIGPVAPSLPYYKGEKLEDPLAMYLGDVFTVDANLAGLPSISFPAGFSENGLPVGIQLMGNHFSENTLLHAAYQLEQTLGLDLVSPVAREVLA